MRHAAARFCRILGQSCLTQRAMAASSRSRARRSGRCTVQPIALRMRQICEGWWRTPVRRQITVWIRLQVHRSVSNPCASAPCSSARSILRRPRAVSLALRPGPVERRAARPPCCHAWYQRCVFWREVPSRWATSAWLVPCSNMRAARSRRRSIPLKSRGSLVGGWCAVVAAISPPLPQPGLLRGLWHTSVSPYSEKLLSPRPAQLWAPSRLNDLDTAESSTAISSGRHLLQERDHFGDQDLHIQLGAGVVSGHAPRLPAAQEETGQGASGTSLARAA